MIPQIKILEEGVVLPECGVLWVQCRGHSR